MSNLYERLNQEEQLEKYQSILARWRIQYKDQIPPSKKGVKNTNLAKKKIKCAKCKRFKEKFNRHHKGNDFFWACLLPDIYAPRYIQFLEEDIAILCEKCHKELHYGTFYKDILYNFYLAMNDAKMVVDKNLCDEYREKCIEMFNKWLNPSEAECRYQQSDGK